MKDLFGGNDDPRPERTLRRNWGLHLDDLDTLERAIPWEQRSWSRDGQTTNMPRLECFLATEPGLSYWYSGMEYKALDVGAVSPTLAGLLDAVGRLMEDDYGATPNAVFANLYRTGSDSIGWHADDERSLGPTSAVVIASLSLGARRRFVMQHRDTGHRVEWALGQGDLLIMGPGCQSEWTHCVPKTAKPSGKRLNLTFRCLQ